MDTSEKFELLNRMGQCKVQPAMGAPANIEQKYCVAFKIWTGSMWVSSTWTYAQTADETIDKMWEEIKEELWIFVTQIAAGH